MFLFVQTTSLFEIVQSDIRAFHDTLHHCILVILPTFWSYKVPNKALHFGLLGALTAVSKLCRALPLEVNIDTTS